MARVWHPLLATSGAEIVLMTKSRKAQSKHGTSRPESSNVHYPRKGWMVAKSYTGGRTLTFSANETYSATVALSNIQTYICRYYTRVGTRTRTQMASLSYAAWRTYGSANFGWARTKTGSKGRNRRMFGLAIRVPNPEWDRLIISGHSLSEHTQTLLDGNSHPMPRYIYSAVAPLLTHITIDSNNYVNLGFDVR